MIFGITESGIAKVTCVNQVWKLTIVIFNGDSGVWPSDYHGTVIGHYRCYGQFKVFCAFCVNVIHDENRHAGSRSIWTQCNISAGQNKVHSSYGGEKRAVISESEV